jgi:hypothetical protein
MLSWPQGEIANVNLNDGDVLFALQLSAGLQTDFTLVAIHTKVESYFHTRIGLCSMRSTGSWAFA